MEAVSTMDSTGTKYIRVSTDSSLPIKKCWGVGKNIVVAIDKEIVKRLGITEDNTYVQQEVTDNGILLRVKHYGKEGKV
ncbi:MAG: hypothetical protein WA364_14755 [Candidatus Nitrosopolaris sp.]